LNGTHPINRPLLKLRKFLELRYKYFSAIQTSIIHFIFTLMHQIISWGQSSHRVEILKVFYLQKLNTAQELYTISERKLMLLSAIETCKEYKTILLGYPIIVFTDYKNNTFHELKASDHILHGQLLLEEYGVTLEYIPGKKNVAAVADAISCLETNSLKIQEEEALTLLPESEKSRISNFK
jgi:hypothetical protein